MSQPEIIGQWLKILNALSFHKANPGYYSDSEHQRLLHESEQFRKQFNNELPHGSTRHIKPEDVVY